MGAVVREVYMDKSILERIMDIYVTFTNRLWEDGSVCIPNNLNDMSLKEKREYADSILRKLEYLISDNQFYTLFSWSWNERYEHLTFEQWLTDEVNNRLIETKEQSNPTVFDNIVNKLSKWKDRKRV